MLETAIEQCEKDIRAVADRHRLKVLDEFLINGDAAIFTVVGYKDDLLHAFNIGVSGYEARRNSGDELSMIVKHKAEVACATIAKEMAGE